MRYWQVFLDVLKDARWVLPIILIIYYLIEFIEFKYAKKLQNNKFLKGKTGPVVGALIGSIPQCGFSLVSADLFSKGALSVGTLLAVFIATSDEALPILIANPGNFKTLLILIISKILLAIAIGYLAGWLFKLLSKSNKNAVDEKFNQETTLQEESIHSGCCHHHVATKKFNWLHPLFHSLKIFAFILIVSILFGCLTEIWLGQEKLVKFLTQSKYLQPVLTAIIGLIPNCVSSVVLTQLYIVGGLRFSSLLTGLMVNAGLGLIYLFKQNKNQKQNLFILLVLLVSALVVGYAFIWLVV